jgi:hypothetical protein
MRIKFLTCLVGILLQINKTIYAATIFPHHLTWARIIHTFVYLFTSCRW